MKRIDKISAIITLLLIVISCTEDERQYTFESLTAPSNVSLKFQITQDNSGLVTFTPKANGATKFQVTFGDAVNEVATEYGLEDEITHTYAEGNYTVRVEAIGMNGLTTSMEEDITVSFRKPENLSITIENDLTVSKQVNISATADYAAYVEFYFGELTADTAVVANSGETVTHVYASAGEYTLTVIAKSGGSATLDSTFAFTVTEITGPQEAAPTPTSREATDVISVFSNAYTSLENTDFNPSWGQATTVSTIAVEGDDILKYANLNYQGTQFENPIDASGMEYLHVDVWTDDASELNFYCISTGPEETAYAMEIESGEWKSYDIPLTAFSSVVDLTDIIQFKVTGTTGSTIYFDNIYFYKEATETTLQLNFESLSWTDFDGGEVTIVDNPLVEGINTSNKVAQMLKNSGQTWGGSYITVEEPIDFSANKTFKLKVLAPKVGTNVLLKVENVDDGSINHGVEVATTIANQWEELSFDYSGIDDTQSYQKIVLIFDNGTMGDGSSDFTYYFDDITLTN